MSVYLVIRGVSNAKIGVHRRWQIHTISGAAESVAAMVVIFAIVDPTEGRTIKVDQCGG